MINPSRIEYFNYLRYWLKEFNNTFQLEMENRNVSNI